jgi:DMSO/TMAO reductase YedYZ heme-binding membrane subunit
MDFFISNLSIVTALVVYGFLHFYNKPIHNHNAYFFLGGLLLSLTLIFIEIPILSLWISNGHLSLGLFMLVMFAGVFRKRWIVYKKILLVRGDLAILGFIFLIPHGIERLSLALNGYQSTGLVAAIVMLPLTISSFMIIRKRIRPDRWKKLHKLAYLAYLMIYIHIGFEIFLNPLNFYIKINEQSLLFHLLFVIYLVLIVNKVLIHRKR